jgi:hypothetical protein
MDVKAIDLFKAYGEGQLPREGGYIVTSFFQDNSAYAKYEIVAYNGVKSLYLTEEGLTFQTDGNKLFVLAEPVNYDKKYVEPFTRDGQHQIPHRFSEVNQLTAKNMTRIMISKQPVIAYSSFTICKPTTLNFSLLFYNLTDVLDTIASYFEKTLNVEANVPAGDAAEAARHIVAGLKRFTIWQDLEQKAAAPIRASMAKAKAKARPKAAAKAKAKPKSTAKPRAAAKARKPAGAKAKPTRKPAAKAARKPARKR